MPPFSHFARLIEETTTDPDGSPKLLLACGHVVAGPDPAIAGLQYAVCPQCIKDFGAKLDEIEPPEESSSSKTLEPEPFEWPTHCPPCGALLKGGATVHADDCPIRKIIEDFKVEMAAPKLSEAEPSESDLAELVADVAAAAREAFDIADDRDMGHYILDGHTPVHVPNADFMQWARWFEKHNDERIVKQEEIGHYRVSTVFLGLDHGFGRMFFKREGPKPPPILFETMVFSVVGTDRNLNVCERCSTWDEAVEQHERVAAEFRKAIAG